MPDSDGYPTDEELDRIAEWPWEDGYQALMDYVKGLWAYQEFGWGEFSEVKKQTITDDTITHTISTAGWSRTGS